MPEPPESEAKGPKSKWIEIEKIVQLGFLFPAAIFIGWLFGALLDRWLHTTWLYLAGLGFGILTGFFKLFRIALNPGNADSEELDSRKPDSGKPD